MTSYPNTQTILRTTLLNGITVLIYENFAAQSVILESIIRAGALGETDNKLGIANFTASCLMRGSRHYTFESLHESLESVGSALSFTAGRHTAGFSGGGLVEDLDLLLNIAADVTRYPTFPLDQVDRLRGEILTGLHVAANNTKRQANKLFRQTLYGKHPYGSPLYGEPETIAQITRDDLIQFHQNYYGNAGMIITLVGAVKADEALAKIEDTFGDWNNPQQKRLPLVLSSPRPNQLKRTHFTMPDKTQTDVVLGLPGPPRSVPDYQATKVANTILGVFGMYGRLGQTVRTEQGLAYYVHSSLSGGLGPTPWSVSTGVAPEKVNQAIKSIQQEIIRIQQQPVTNEELANTQAYITGSLPVSLETNSGLSSIITDIELYGLGLDYLVNFSDEINTVTIEDVQTTAQKYFSADEIVVASAGP